MIFKIILTILLILSQVGDILLTEKILKAGGVELNPIVKRYGYWIKIPATVLAILVGFIVNPVIMIPVVVIMIAVCMWNYRVLRGL